MRKASAVVEGRLLGALTGTVLRSTQWLFLRCRIATPAFWTKSTRIPRSPHVFVNGITSYGRGDACCNSHSIAEKSGKHA